MPTPIKNAQVNETSGNYTIGLYGTASKYLHDAAEAFRKSGAKIWQNSSDTTSVLCSEVVSECGAIEEMGRKDGWISICEGIGYVANGVASLVSVASGLYTSRKYTNEINACNQKIDRLQNNIKTLKEPPTLTSLIPAKRAGKVPRQATENSQITNKLCTEDRDFTKTPNDIILSRTTQGARTKILQSCEKKLDEAQKDKNEAMTYLQNVIQTSNIVGQSVSGIAQGIPKFAEASLKEERADQEAMKTVLGTLSGQVNSIIGNDNQSARTCEENATGSYNNAMSLSSESHSRG